MKYRLLRPRPTLGHFKICIVLYCIALHDCITLHCIALHCVVLQCVVWYPPFNHFSFRPISYNVWHHLTATWDQERGIGKILINSTLKARKELGPAGDVMNNSHTYYQIGSKKDSGETFHGLVRKIKVFKKVLTTSEINMEASGNDENGRFPFAA